MNPVNRIRELEKKRARFLNALLESQPVLKGSLLNLKRPCGRGSCRCEKGKLHRQMIISSKKKGKTKFVYVRKEDQKVIQKYADNRKRFQKTRKEITSAEKKIWRAIQKLERQIAFHYQRS